MNTSELVQAIPILTTAFDREYSTDLAAALICANTILHDRASLQLKLLKNQLRFVGLRQLRTGASLAALQSELARVKPAAFAA